MTTQEDTSITDRIHASRWYRITPRSFQNIEIFFDSERVLFVFAGESYKSFLLRQNGRNDRAQKVGEEQYDLSAQQILSKDRNEAVSVDLLQRIRLASGSLLRKPKLVLETADQERMFYHPSRDHKVQSLAQQLAEQYSSVPLILDKEDISSNST
jgi:hypothetical protein